MLIDVRQIRNGLAMYNDVQNLRGVDGANYVLTEFLKGDEVTQYNVNEYLGVLKAAVEALGGTGTGSLGDLEAQIAVINDTPIKDIVKITTTVDVDALGGASLAIAEVDVDGNIPGVPSVDTTRVYGVYFTGSDAVENKPLRDENGDQITYDFATGVLTGAPHTRSTVTDPATQEVTLVFTPMAEGSYDVKLFPVGTFTFASLPPAYLLDNNEMKLIAYSEVIDEIILGLAQNDELISQIQALVTEEAIIAVLEDITSALEGRIEANEEDIALLNSDDLTVGSVAYAVKTAQDTLQGNIDDVVEDLGLLDGRVETLEGKVETLEGDHLVAGSVDFKIAAAQTILQGEIDDLEEVVITNDIASQNADLDLGYDIALINAVTDVVDDSSTTLEQEDFVLSEVPNATPVVMFVNGVRYKETAHFTVDRVLKTLTWTYTDASEGFDMAAGFDISIKYKTTAAVAPVEYVV